VETMRRRDTIQVDEEAPALAADRDAPQGARHGAGRDERAAPRRDARGEKAHQRKRRDASAAAPTAKGTGLRASNGSAMPKRHALIAAGRGAVGGRIGRRAGRGRAAGLAIPAAESPEKSLALSVAVVG